MLTTLAYVSRSLVPAHDVAMLDIARSSLRNNARLGVTGALYFDGTLFFQVLEGDEAVLAVLFDTIRNDPRHCDVEMVCHKPLTERQFPNWSMKFVEGQCSKTLARQFRYENLVQHGCDAQSERIAALHDA
jgi:hypothetical protein